MKIAGKILGIGLASFLAMPVPGGIDVPKPVIKIMDLGLRLEDVHIIFPPWTADKRLVISDFDLSISAPAGTEPMDLQAKFQGELHWPALEDTAEFSGQAVVNLDDQQYILKNADLDFKLTGPDLPTTGLQGRLMVTAVIDIPAGSATINSVTLKTLQLKIKGELMARGFPEVSDFEGKLAVAEFSPREVLAALDKPSPKTRDKTVLTEAALDLTLTGNARELTIQSIEGHLDDTRVSGRITAKNPTNPIIRFDLQLDELDLDRYRSPETDPATAPDPSTVLAGPPLETLRGLNLRGNLRIGKLTINNQSTGNMVIRVQWDPE